MYYEGDIKPVVKRVRPYKTLLINLPPKSFGFWVLANTKIEACQNVDKANKKITETEDNTENVKVKRSIDEDFEDYTHLADLSYDFEDSDALTTDNKELKSRVLDINRDLDKVHSLFKTNKGRVKRDDEDSSVAQTRLTRHRLRNKLSRHSLGLDLNAKRLLGDILQKAKHNVDILKNKGLREVKRKLGRNRLNKRHSRNYRKNTKTAPMKYKNRHSMEMINKKPLNKYKIRPKEDTKIPTKVKKYNQKSAVAEKNDRQSGDVNELPKRTVENEAKLSRKNSIENEILKDESRMFEPKIRKRRHVLKDTEETSSEHEDKDKDKMWKIIKEIHNDIKDTSRETESKDGSQEAIVLKTELSDDTATIQLTDGGKGVLKSTMKKMVDVLEDLNKNLNRFWGALTLLD